MNEGSQINPFSLFIVKGIVRFFEEYLYGVLVPNQYITCRWWIAGQLSEGLKDGLQCFSWINTIVVKPAESLSLSLVYFQARFSRVKCVLYETRPEDGGDVCAAGSM